MNYLYSQAKHYYYQIFYKHPHEQNVSYVQHFCISSQIGISFFIASVQAMIHAFIPCCFKTSSSEWLRILHDYMENCYDKHKK